MTGSLLDPKFKWHIIRIDVDKTVEPHMFKWKCSCGKKARTKFYIRKSAQTEGNTHAVTEYHKQGQGR